MTGNVQKKKNCTVCGILLPKTAANPMCENCRKRVKNIEGYMISQLAALSVFEGHEVYRYEYVFRLTKLGFTKEEAELIFSFDCDVIKRYKKEYLLMPNFTKMWVFGLRQPFFSAYPKEKSDILKERFLTLSELCKIIDEAEWHFWNGKNILGDVRTEIFEWHLGGKGGAFLQEYHKMVSETTGVPYEKLLALSNMEQAHLRMYKWH